MKLASYNLWDSPAGMPHRREQITSVLSALNADILCLQEDSAELDFPSTLPDLPFCACHREAGLTILSRYPIKDTVCMPYALVITVSYGCRTLCIVNLHLPWQSALLRETEIIAITDAAARLHADFTLLAGDFNCSDMSSVHRFLCGDQSLCGRDAYYFDLAEAYADMTGIPPSPTLDFRRNPRWGIIDPPNTLEKNQRFDRILLANPYPNPAPMLSKFGVFGSEISEETRLAPSDHLGVYADLDFS